MANEFIIRKGYKSLSDSQITGSLSVSNAVTASFFTGSFRGDGSELTGIDGFPFTGSASISGSLTVVGPVTATEFIGNGSQLTGIDGFPFTGSAAISGSLTVDGNVIADSFTGSIQGTATTASYVNIANVDGFTAYSSSVNTAIGSVLDATTPITATINNTNSPFTITNQTIVIVDSTNGNVTVNLPDLDTVVGTPNQRPIIIYKNDYSQNVVYVQPNGSELVNGSSQDIIVSIQLAVIYNPTSAGWVTEGTSAQSLAELELFFVPRTETGSLSVATASYVEYTDVVNKPTLVSGSSQISFSGITNKPTLVSGSSQITYSGLTGKPSGIVSSSVQVKEYNVFATTGSNGFNGNQAITGSLTVTGQVVAQTLNVQQVTSSIVYSSGSNIFGNSLSNTQQFTGSVGVTGSLSVNGTSAVVGTGSTNYLPKFTGTSTIGNSIIYDDGAIGINNTTPSSYYNSQLVVGNDSAGFGSITMATTSTGLNSIFFSRSSSGAGRYRGSISYVQSSDNINFRNSGDLLRMTLDGSGNLGLGVTPSAWYSTIKALQIGNTTALWSSGGNTILGENVYTNASDANIYLTNDFATQYRQVDGQHIWYIAPSGTAGNVISFTQAMTLTSGGKLLINSTDSTKTPLLLNAEGNFASSGNMTSGFAITNTSFGRALNMGVFESGAYGWIQAAYINNADTTFALTLQPRGGNVGIGTGTTSPSNILSIVQSNSASATTLDVTNSSNASSTAKTAQLLFRLADTANTIKNAAYVQAIPDGVNVLDAHLSFGTRLSDTGPTERMRITSAGNVGIGTTSPTTYSLNGRHLEVNDAGGGYSFIHSNTTNVKSFLATNESLGLTALFTFSSHPLTLGTNNTERMRITSGGFLKASNNGSYADANGAYYEILSNQGDTNVIKITNSHGSSPYGPWLYHTTNKNNGVNYFLVGEEGANVRRFAIFTNGGISNYQANDVNLSDERTKKDITPLESYWDKFKVLEIVKFKYKDQTHDDFNIGVIAQQVEQVAPEFVDVDGWNTRPKLDEEGNEIVSEEEPLKSIYTADLYHATIKVLQECMSKIEEQQSQIEILKAEIQTLKQ